MMKDGLVSTRVYAGQQQIPAFFYQTKSSQSLRLFNIHSDACVYYTLTSHQHERKKYPEQSMGARNRVGIGLWYRPARLHRLARIYNRLISPGIDSKLHRVVESIPRKQFLGSLKV
jgi:hypothetical protein